MDQELIAYFDRNFQEVSRQIQSLRDEMNQRFEQVDARFEQIDIRFVQVGGRFEEVTESVQHNRILIEGLRSHLKLVAEGMVGTNESFASFKIQNTKDHQSIEGLIRQVPFVELETRIRELEVWRETKERDPIDIIRERLKNKTL